jgi:hypothetical protein
MDDKEFSNREITAQFANVIEKLNDHGVVHTDILKKVADFRTEILAKVGEVHTETKATNGKIADVNKWREQVNGGAKVAAFFMAVIVIPLLGWAVFVLSSIDTKINESVQNVLSTYDIES